MIELYSDLVTLYNKVHFLHIKTVKMEWTCILHDVLGGHYGKLQDIVDRFWEDVLVKSDKELPTTSECLKKSTINEEMMLESKDEITDDLYKDYEYLKNRLKEQTNKEKNLLIQNILIDMWDEFTKFCADISRIM